MFYLEFYLHFYLHFEYTVNSDYEKTKINIFNNKNVTKFPNQVLVLDSDPEFQNTSCYGSVSSFLKRSRVYEFILPLVFRFTSAQDVDSSNWGSSGRRRPRRPGSLKLSFPS